jgi:hypothetical protein
MDDITQNGFNHPKFSVNASNLVLMLHKFGINVSNLMLMPKKSVVLSLQFYFFLKLYFM